MAWLFFHQLLQRGVKGTVSPSTTRTKNALSKPPEVTVHVPSFQKGTDAASWLHLNRMDFSVKTPQTLKCATINITKYE